MKAAFLTGSRTFELREIDILTSQEKNLHIPATAILNYALSII